MAAGCCAGTATTQSASAFAKQVERRRRRITALASQVVEKRDAVAAARQAQQKARNAHRTDVVLEGWRHGFEFVDGPDRQLRHSDRLYAARTYSLMDQAVWERDEMRSWFARYAKGTLSPDNFNIEQEKYVVAAQHGSATASDAPSPSVGQKRHGMAVDASIAACRVAAARVGQPPMPASHWLDNDAVLAECRAHDDAHMARLPPPEASIWGHTHMRGTRSPPWLERPPHKNPGYVRIAQLKEREAAVQRGLGLEQYPKLQVEVQSRREHCYHGHRLFDPAA